MAVKRIKKGRNKKAKALYDALRYRKKKLINLIEDLTAKLSNIYGNIYKKKGHKNLFDFSKADIENLYKKAVFNKDKYAIKTLKELGAEYSGRKTKITNKLVNTMEEDLRKNIYGTRISKLRESAKKDLENFNRLMEGLTDEQKIEFLNSTSYYGARRYQKPPAESETFIMQVEQDGASYIVQDIIKYYKDHGIAIPDLLSIKGKNPNTYKTKQKEEYKKKGDVQMKF